MWMKSFVFSDVAQCRFVRKCQFFVGALCFYLQGSLRGNISLITLKMGAVNACKLVLFTYEFMQRLVSD